MHAIAAGRERQISARVDQDLSGRSFTCLACTHRHHRRGELEKLARGNVLFADLYEVDSQVYLIANDFQQRTESADRLSIRYVVALHRPVNAIASTGAVKLSESESA